MMEDSNSKTGLTPLVVRSQVCVATAAYSAYHGMSQWCQLNCLNYPPHCPPTICTCLSQCQARPGQSVQTDFSCSRSCLRFPHTEECPAECQCTSNPGSDFSGLEAVIIDARKTGKRKQPEQPAAPIQTQTRHSPVRLLYSPRLHLYSYP